MSLRPAQLALRLGADTDHKSQSWCDGAVVTYQGEKLTIRLDSIEAIEAPASLSAQREDTTRVDNILHLPLPPQASPRQIQDRAEAWLRSEAERCFNAIIARHTPASAAPTLHLSFATRAGWTEVDTTRANQGRLRVNWRLIEQTPEVIEQILTRALHELAALQARNSSPDLFGAFA